MLLRPHYHWRVFDWAFIHAISLELAHSRYCPHHSRRLRSVELEFRDIASVGCCALFDYVLLVVYPSVSLTHLRSFAEHRADDHSQRRTNVVEAHPLWGLLFLNNNLHVAHHTHPHVPWYELPRLWRNMRGSGAGAGKIFRGYGEVARHYLLRPFITAEHPIAPLEVE